MSGPRHATLAGEVIDTSPNAIRFLEAGKSRTKAFWIPRSVCLDGSEIEKGDTDIVVATWWLEQNT
ncbi:MAG: hypothetical protein AB7S41_08950 [Parvibaculaceae bacterium]